MEKTKIDWNGPIQVAIVAGIILGANIPFFVMHRSELRSIEQEMKDFHKELIRIDEKIKG